MRCKEDSWRSWYLRRHFARSFRCFEGGERVNLVSARLRVEAKQALPGFRECLQIVPVELRIDLADSDLLAHVFECRTDQEVSLS